MKQIPNPPTITITQNKEFFVEIKDKIIKPTAKNILGVFMKIVKFVIIQILILSCLVQAKAKLPPHLNQGYDLAKRSHKSLSLEWSELELYSIYSSVSDIIYTDDSKRRYLLFPKGSQFRLNEIIPIPQISTIYFKLIHQNCTIPSLNLDVFLFENVVLTLEPGCVLGVYVEAKDYYYRSLFY